MGILVTLGQHEFAFGFCGSVGVEISRMRSLAAGDRCSSSTLVGLLAAKQCDYRTGNVVVVELHKHEYCTLSQTLSRGTVFLSKKIDRTYRSSISISLHHTKNYRICYADKQVLSSRPYALACYYLVRSFISTRKQT